MCVGTSYPGLCHTHFSEPQTSSSVERYTIVNLQLNSYLLMSFIPLDVIAEDNYKMDTIKRTEALELKQEALQQQIVHLEQELTESNQLLQRQLEEQERLGSTQHNSLQSRLNILDRFREDSNRWSKFQHDQEFRNRRLSEATTSVSSRVTKLEIKYTTAIRDLQKKMRKMDHTAAGNFKVVAKYTEAIQTYCAENEEKLQKMAEAIFDIHDQVNQELRAFQTQIKDLEYKLARLQSAYSSYSSITKRREAPPAKDKGSKDKQPDIANEAASLKSTLKCVKPIDEAL